MQKNTVKRSLLQVFYRNFKIRGRVVFVIIAGLSLHLILMLSVFHMYGTTYLKTKIYHHIGNMQKEISMSIELLIDDIQMISLRLLVNSDIYQVIGNDQLNYDEKNSRVHPIIEEMVSNNGMIGNVFILTNDNEQYSYDNSGVIFENPDDLLIAKVKNSIIPITDRIKHDSNGEAYVVFGQQYRNFNTSQNIGIILFYIKESSLFQMYNTAFEGLGYSYISTSDNEIISHPDKSIVGRTLLETDAFHPINKDGYQDISYQKNKYVLSAHSLDDRLKNFGVTWQIVSIISYPLLFDTVYKGNRDALVFTFFTFIGLLILSFYIAAKIAKPIVELTMKIRTLGKRGLEQIVVEGTDRDEISELEHSYYSMIERINHLIDENNDEKEKQRAMELTALQSQINPHFLYNTLDAIKWTARLKKQSDIEQMISALSTFFRISLHKGDKHIPIEDEIKLVQSFVTVELFRFPDKFEVLYHIPDHLKKVRILKLILQPLVENAIKHGMSEKAEKGTIEVSCWEEANYLFLKVTDDGIGFLQNNDIQSISKNQLFQSGYGLRNVDARIKLEYGLDSHLMITSTPGQGTTAIITLNLTNYLL